MYSRMDKCQSYALTIRPLDGVTDEQIASTLKWVKRTCDYYHVITEKTGSERHIHAGLFCKNPKTRSNVVTELMRLFKDLTPSEKSVLRQGLKVMYNGDFIKNYLAKGDDTVVVESLLPEKGHMESYFTPKPSLKVKDNRKSLYYHELERMWYEYRTPGYEVTTITARDFLFELMYSRRCLTVIRDDRQICQVARHLTRWLKMLSSSTIEIPPFESEE